MEFYLEADTMGMVEFGRWWDGCAVEGPCMAGRGALWLVEAGFVVDRSRWDVGLSAGECPSV